MRTQDLTAAKFAQWDTNEFYSRDLCVTLVRYPETRLEYVINRAYRVIVERSINIEWIRTIANDIATEHQCICCSRHTLTILIGPIGVFCKACFELLYSLCICETRENIMGIGDVLCFSDVLLCKRDRSLHTYIVRRVFGCNWCLYDMTKKYIARITGNNAVSSHGKCVMCASVGASTDITCIDKVYQYCYDCYDCYERGIMCIYALIEKYLLMYSCIGVSDICAVIIGYLLAYLERLCY